MRRLNFSYEATSEEIVGSYEDYRKYLFSIKDALPESAFEFAIADWHYDHNDPRCPHDARLDSLEMTEKYVSNLSLKERAPLEITIILLSSFHNGRIRLSYRGVRYYSLEKFPISGIPTRVLKEPTTYHGDWLVDELCLSEDNFVVHEIDFAFGATWKIHCDDVKYEWLPL